jgi:uncharacterized protein (TIGR03437 family)
MLYRTTLLFSLLVILATPLALDAQPAGTILGISYATYLGGSGYDRMAGVAVDSAGNAYVTGVTASTDFPTLNALYATYRGGAYDVVVVKYSPSGQMIYSTYMGGSGTDQAFGIAVDAAGNAYVVGTTTSPDFPSVNPTPGQPVASSSSTQAFVFKLDPTGQKLLYSTLLGFGQPNSVAVDAAGNAYVAGAAYAASFPTVGSLQAFGGGSEHGFVTKIAPAGGQIVYSTFLGGSGSDFIRGVAVDSSGNAYVAGTTGSSDFPTKNAFQSKFAATGNGYFIHGTAFVAKLNPAGSALVYSTFLGGSTSEGANGIAVDSLGSAYVTGYAASTDFPVKNAFQPFLAPLCPSEIHESVYVAKFDPSGSSLAYSTLIGGACLDEYGEGIAVDAQGSAYVTGRTSGNYFPPTGALPPAQAGPALPGSDGGMFVLKLAPSGSALVYASLFGGPGIADPFAGGASLAQPANSYAIAIDPAGNAFTAGFTESTTFPTVNAQQPKIAGVPSLDGNFDGFVVKFSAQSGGSVAPVTTSLAPAALNINSPAIALQVNGSGFVASSVVQWNGVARPTTVVSATQLTAALTATDLAAPGAQWVNVFTPGPGGGTSNYVQFTVNGSLPPTLNGISAQELTAGGPAATIIVSACNLTASSVLQWNGVAMPTSPYTGSKPIGGLIAGTGVSCLFPTVLQATIPASDLVAGTAQITFFTPAPGGGTSAAFVFTVLPAPVLNAGTALLNAASYTSQVAPGGLASLFGANFTATTSCPNASATSLCGVSVEMNGVAVPLLYVGPTQANLQIPWELVGQSTATIDVLANGVRSPSVSVSLASAAPAIFTLNQQGTGQGAILLAGTAVVAGPANPVTAGNAIEIYMVGLGAVSNPPATGAQARTQSLTLVKPTVTIGGVPATVLYSGLAPTFIGLYQVNVQIPSGVTLGAGVPLVVTMNGAVSNPVTIAVH